MNNGRKEYTFFWFIENYSYCCLKEWERLSSPCFTVDGLESKFWNLILYPRGCRDEDKGFVSLFLARNVLDRGPDYFSISFELSFLAADGSTLSSVESDHTFQRRYGSQNGSRQFLRMDEIYLRRKADYLPKDTLTVRCKIWNGEGSVHNIGQCSARTRIKVERISYLHVVETFNSLLPNVKHTFQSHSKNGLFIFSSLYLTEGLNSEQKIMIEIVASDTKYFLCKCEISLVDRSGNAKKCCKVDTRHNYEVESIRELQLSLTREEVISSESEYLSDGKLSLICKCTFFSGIEFKTIEETQHGVSTVAVKRARNQLSLKSLSSSSPSALEDIKDLYVSQCLTDVELKTRTKSFQAHKMLLCARSPVFKRMMIHDMKEKNSDFIQIDDLGDDVLQKMLLFMYSDAVENLDWEIATQLYYAADKYQVGKLKEICFSFLVANLSPNNAGELLLLADTHSDRDLKKLVEDFILEHTEQVFCTEEWEMLIETHPLLVVKAMLLKYKIKRKSK